MAKVYEYRYEVLIRDRGPKKRGPGRYVRMEGDNPANIRKHAGPMIRSLGRGFMETNEEAKARRNASTDSGVGKGYRSAASVMAEHSIKPATPETQRLRIDGETS